MVEEREAKRTRQACQNCRRKKTRCSGERPSCFFCVRLNQRCEYANGGSGSGAGDLSSRPFPSGGDNSHPVAVHEPDLAARVAFLESRLGVYDKEGLLPSTAVNIESPPTGLGVPSTRSGLSSHSLFSNTSAPQARFSILPGLDVLRALTDLYFAECHNQPYCYFSECAFRSRLEGGGLPEYLLMAFVAATARYSSHVFFENCQSEAIETYSRTAWHVILQQVFSSDQGLDLHAIQATHMLAVIDFTAGQPRLGWVKVGLAVRFAQGLRLNAEPDPALPLWQQEERRRVFWSVYMVDRFVSCCRVRPPTILDVDCTVRLPSSEAQFRTESPSDTPTIAVLRMLPDIEKCRSLDYFALLVLMASSLGRIVRFSLQQITSKGYPPWDFRSDFAKISSILLSFETLLSIEDTNLSGYLNEHFRVRGEFDRQRVGHFVWCRGLYHLCCCLIHHPFLLHRYLQSNRQTFPRSFARESLQRCREHANQLTHLLTTVQEQRCCARGSFLAYFAAVASSVHRLYEHSSDANLKTQSLISHRSCLAFLEQPPVAWNNYSRTAKAVRGFDIKPETAQALIGPSPTNDCIDANEMDTLWRILDYSWLSDANRPDLDFQQRQSPPAHPDPGTWDPLNDLLVGDLSLPLAGLPEHDSGLAGIDSSSNPGDWWHYLSSGRPFQGSTPDLNL